MHRTGHGRRREMRLNLSGSAHYPITMAARWKPTVAWCGKWTYRLVAFCELSMRQASPTIQLSCLPVITEAKGFRTHGHSPARRWNCWKAGYAFRQSCDGRATSARTAQQPKLQFRWTGFRLFSRSVERNQMLPTYLMA